MSSNKESESKPEVKPSYGEPFYGEPAYGIIIGQDGNRRLFHDTNLCNALYNGKQQYVVLERITSVKCKRFGLCIDVKAYESIDGQFGKPRNTLAEEIIVILGFGHNNIKIRGDMVIYNLDHCKELPKNEVQDIEDMIELLKWCSDSKEVLKVRKNYHHLVYSRQFSTQSATQSAIQSASQSAESD
jgi:hypothetical protein